MYYFNPLTDSYGYTHSIDMVYTEYFLLSSFDEFLSLIRKVHEDYPNVKYEEHLDRKPSSNYDFFLSSVLFGGCRVSWGKYRNYDKLSKTFDMLKMVELRVNPNKHMNEAWFNRLLHVIKSCTTSGYLRKFDYAIDVPYSPKRVQVLNTRKEPGLYKGTRYYGQPGRHGYLKVYDKQKDLKRIGIDLETPLTRVEHTLFTSKPISLENVAVFDDKNLNTDYESLNETDRAIVEMYSLLRQNGINYDLKLGRVKFDKLKEYISGAYVLLKYDLLDSLLQNICEVFCAELTISQEDWISQDDDLDDLPIPWT